MKIYLMVRICFESKLVIELLQHSHFLTNYLKL